MTSEPHGESAVHTEYLTRWAYVILSSLVLAIFGSLGVAWKKGPVEETRGGGRKSSVVVNVGGASETPEPPPPEPRTLPPGVVLDLDVNAVGALPPAGGQSSPGNAGAGTTQTVNVTGAPVSVRPSAGGDVTSTVAVPGGAGRDAETPAPTPRICTNPDAATDVSEPCAEAELLGRIRFAPGGRKILPLTPDQIEYVVHRLGARAGALLVIGHNDSCTRESLAGRRAKKARRALRRFLKSRPEWRNGRLRIHAQGAGEDPGAPEQNCEDGYYRTAGVYLIEGLM